MDVSGGSFWSSSSDGGRGDSEDSEEDAVGLVRCMEGEEEVDASKSGFGWRDTGAFQNAREGELLYPRRWCGASVDRLGKASEGSDRD